ESARQRRRTLRRRIRRPARRGPAKRLLASATRASKRGLGRAGFEPAKAESQQIYSLPRLATSVPNRLVREISYILALAACNLHRVSQRLIQDFERLLF